MARDILREINGATDRQSGNKVGALTGPLTMLYTFGYVERNDLKPYGYRISVKGLKFLNKIIGDYD